MHCPNCRSDNPATTRFCTACGAVLVESTKTGGRRRVLRPWGLRSAAPPTESPAMPEIVAAVQRGRRPLSRRLDLRFAAGTLCVVLAGSFLFPYARALEGVRADVVEHAPPPLVVATTATHAARETTVASPPLVEPVATAVKPRAAPKAQVAPPREAPAREPMPEIPNLPVAATTADPVVAAAHEPSPTVVAPSAPTDPLATLRSALARCGQRAGVFERATCEQGARLAHCDSYWGHTPLCPTRSDHVQ